MAQDANKCQFSITAKIKKKILPKFNRMFVTMYLCIYIIPIVATPFNSQLRNFDTTFPYVTI